MHWPNVLNSIRFDCFQNTVYLYSTLGRSDLIVRLESPARIEIFPRIENFFIFYFYVMQKKSFIYFLISQLNSKSSTDIRFSKFKNGQKYDIKPKQAVSL